MVNPNRFYTYAYLREDKTPYYIGKGSKDRLYKRGKKCTKPPKDKSRIIFLKKNLTEEEAFKHEVYMIAVFGRKDNGTGILYNKTDGGEGNSGLVPGEETRRKISEANKGRRHSEESIRKMRESLTTEQRSEITKKRQESRTPEQRSETIRKMQASRTSEQRSEAAKKGQANKTPEQRSEIARKREASKTPEQRSESARKMGETNKGKKWWNDNCGNSKKSMECPGEGWVLGRGKLKVSKTDPESN